MLFSIVIINFNYVLYLAEAIDSALSQTYSDVEVIVVDDGSTDESRSVIERYGRKIIPVFKPNGGQGSAYNAGFERVQGDMVLFLDADDLLRPDACQKVVHALKDDTVKVQFPLSIIGPKSESLGARIPTLRMMDGDVKHTLMRFGTHGGPPASGNAFRRTFLDKVLPLPAEKWRMGSDNFLTLQAPFHGNVITIAEELGMYRQHRKHGSGGSGDFQLGIGNASGLNKVLELVSQDDQFLGEVARMHGFKFKSGMRSRNPAFNKNLLCAALLDRAPTGSPKRFQLGFVGGWYCLWFPLYSPKRRVLGALWFLVAGLAPRGLARKTVRFALDPTSRKESPANTLKSGGGSL